METGVIVLILGIVVVIVIISVLMKKADLDSVNKKKYINSLGMTFVYGE